MRQTKEKSVSITITTLTPERVLFNMLLTMGFGDGTQDNGSLREKDYNVFEHNVTRVEDCLIYTVYLLRQGRKWTQSFTILSGK